MQKASDELDDAIKTVKKEFGTVKLFNKTVNKIKKMFNKFIQKHPD